MSPLEPAQKKWTLDKLKVLDICQHIHKHAEEIYLHLAEVHRPQRDIARIWGLMAVDKCNHSDTFKMASRLKGEGISDICISTETAADILAKMKSILAGIRHQRPTPMEALSFAIKMEESLDRLHFRNAVGFYNEQDIDLMTSPLKSSSSNIRMLTEEYINLTLLD